MSGCASRQRDTLDRFARDPLLDRAARQVSRCVKCFSNKKVASTGLFRPLSKQPRYTVVPLIQ
jgi:hypothetical protein